MGIAARVRGAVHATRHRGAHRDRHNLWRRCVPRRLHCRSQVRAQHRRRHRGGAPVAPKSHHSDGSREQSLPQALPTCLEYLSAARATHLVVLLLRCCDMICITISIHRSIDRTNERSSPCFLIPTVHDTCDAYAREQGHRLCWMGDHSTEWRRATLLGHANVDANVAARSLLIRLIAALLSLSL